MRIGFFIAITCSLMLVSLAAIIGCSSKAKVCTVSPIDIEEVKSDSRDIDQELAVVRERLGKAQEDLAAWQERLAQRKAEVPLLEAELERAKIMSGVTEKMEIDVQPKPQQAREIKLMPRGE
ncbi:MAG: hypothetical protein OEN01_12200 [Candidatus Krumholzibacteria bacterium]|nr:hypothetical protein [Candidatus Krumholzibacteria bacterium]